MKHITLYVTTLLLAVCAGSRAQNWDVIVSSGDYYYGLGRGATEEEAYRQALAQLSASIVTMVKSDFTYLADETHRSGTHDFEERVKSCVQTYSEATLTNVRFFEPEQQAGEHVRRCYMARSEFKKVTALRISHALSMVKTADEALARRQIDYALQYYYWAYCLVRSLQYPTEAKDSEGNMLVDRLPLLIEAVLRDISFAVESVDGSYASLLAYYQGKPVSSLQFFYNDGREQCAGSAKDGRAELCMTEGHHDAFHLNVDYECLNQADADVKQVLEVVPKRFFPSAKHTLKNDGKATMATISDSRDTNDEQRGRLIQPDFSLVNTRSQKPDGTDAYAAKMEQIVNAVAQRRYNSVIESFTPEGLDMWNRLVRYGSARLVGTPKLKYYKAAGGGVVVRGLQMAFTFEKPRKRTFVEDIAFTFSGNGKIENVAFGLGKETTNDLLGHQGSGWTDATREVLTEFLESYKTAYSLKRLDYLRDVFADDATIIVGHVAWRKSQSAMTDSNMRFITDEGKQKIGTNILTKDEYLERLAKVFRRNEFINLRFSNCEARWLEKFRKKSYGERELFAIQIGQDYASSLYSDQGYLFLLVDLTNPSEPTIHIRTWQPNEVDMDKVYSVGDFFE